MATPFESIYSKFLLSVTDKSLSKFTNDELEEILYEYLDTSANVYFKQCKKNLQDIDKVLKVFNKDLTSEEIYILSLGMVLNWIQPKILHENKMRQSLGDRDYKLSSNWQTLNTLMSIEEKTEKKLKNAIQSYIYIRDDLEL